MTSIARTVARATIRAAGAITIAGLALGIATGPAAAATPATTPQTTAVNNAAYLQDTPNLPYGPDTCIVPFVWRAARPGDSVCVTAPIRTATAVENAQGPSHHWLFGDFCTPGYTFRAAYPGDRVCVTYFQAAQVIDDNNHTQQRYARNQPAPTPTTGTTTGTTGPTADETELARLINDARTNPQNYPPAGDTTGATMTACPTPFTISPALTDTGRAHNQYLATQPIDVVNTYPNMHIDPNGQLAWANGEPMDQAGYHTFRAEIVATGFTTPADAIRFWMQNDAGSAWGHRNHILDCTIAEAGSAHLQSAPGGHYWTVDMGTK